MNEIDLTTPPSSKKRKRVNDDGETTSSSKHPLLDSICNRFQQNHSQRQSKMKELQTKREAELAHSNFIKRNMADPTELRRADEAVKYWVKRNGVRDAPILGSASTNQQTRSPVSSRLNNQSQQRTQTTNQNAQQEPTNKQSARQKQKSATDNKNSEDKIKKKDSTKNSGSLSDTSSTFSLDLTGSDDENIEFPSHSTSSSKRNVINTQDIPNNEDAIEILDTSNNSSPKPCSSSNLKEPKETKKYVTRQTPRHVCMVMNCEAVFSSEGALGQHRNLFQHSPCNPCLKAIDCKILPDPQCFMCPQCDKEFETTDECRKHMQSAGHMTFYPPLSITCYMCAQCLFVFTNYQTCWEHIVESRHNDISYPFKDDQGANSAGGIGPVPVAEELLQDLMKKCRKVAYKLQCLDCSFALLTPAMLRHHMMETSGQHVVSVFTDSNLVDVFAEYLAGYSCDTCNRLFNGELKELATHTCAIGISGMIIENNTRSFSEFVKRCALTIIKSEELSTGGARSPSPKPGPSRTIAGTSPRRKNKRLSVIEICDSPVVSVSESPVISVGASPVISVGESPVISVSDDEMDLTKGLSAGVAISSKSGKSQSELAENVENKKTSTKWDQPENSSNSQEKAKGPKKNCAKQKTGKQGMEKSLASPQKNTQKDERSDKVENKTKTSRWDQAKRPDSHDTSEIEMISVEVVNEKQELKRPERPNSSKSSDIEMITVDLTDKKTRWDPPSIEESVRAALTSLDKKKSQSDQLKREGSDTSMHIDLTKPQENASEVKNTLSQSNQTGNLRKKTRWDQGEKTASTSTSCTSHPASLETQAQSHIRPTTTTQPVQQPGFTGSTSLMPQPPFHIQPTPSTLQAMQLPFRVSLAIPSRAPPACRVPTQAACRVPTQGHIQQVPSSGNQKNFYCHPPPTQNPSSTLNTQIGSSTSPPDVNFRPPPSTSPRYPLRNQGKTDTVNPVNAVPKQTVGIRIGSADPGTRNKQPYCDQEVAGPSNMSDTNNQTKDVPSLKRDRSRSPVIGESSLISVENLMEKTNIIFLDLDNWPGFFSKLPRALPEGTFVWGFFGGKNVWREPFRCYIFKQMKQRQQFYLNEQCGTTKDAADFAIVLTVGKMDVLLPTTVSFTILSGDKGFCEVERQMKMSKRKAVVVNPHQAEQWSNTMIYTMVSSVCDT